LFIGGHQQAKVLGDARQTLLSIFQIGQNNKNDPPFDASHALI
jgi:hypothetical protein